MIVKMGRFIKHYYFYLSMEEFPDQRSPLEKVLTVSLEEYTKHLDAIGKNIEDYKLVGVHFSKIYFTFDDREGKPYQMDDVNVFLNDFAKRIPATAEVVIAFNDNLSTSNASYSSNNDFKKLAITYRASGVALVPKKKKRHNPEINEGTDE